MHVRGLERQLLLGERGRGKAGEAGPCRGGGEGEHGATVDRMMLHGNSSPRWVLRRIARATGAGMNTRVAALLDHIAVGCASFRDGAGGRRFHCRPDPYILVYQFAPSPGT